MITIISIFLFAAILILIAVTDKDETKNLV
jgi:hypothetical protein